ncbi:MAG TPA: hypothetical protein DCS13_00255 [Candidatus Margulisbacteria bacterium]|nr:MAG: hypothetical protein A2X43_04775 [Candidatus Margulisbacteria bacterium GWD2_39_127]HAR61875.1 hypothetical protein [Candidatus Margulisiibacteriota bacterium]
MKQLILVSTLLFIIGLPFVNAAPMDGMVITQEPETGLYTSIGSYYQTPAVVSVNGTINDVRFFAGNNLEVSSVVESTAKVIFSATNEVLWKYPFETKDGSKTKTRGE